ncbi:MAG: hypothetical protein AAB443_04080 [Patescibacteria group bacterium]
MNKNLLIVVLVVMVAIGAFFAGFMVRGQKQEECTLNNNQQKSVLETPKPTSTIQGQPQDKQPTSSSAPTVKEEEKQPEVELVFTNYNSAGVGNGPTKPTVFTLAKTRTIYLIQDYHWNSATGKTPGTIWLKAASGEVYGPWSAEGAPGQGGVTNAYWTVYPKMDVPVGTYTIIDSDPASWAHNAGTSGVGMSQVYAVK